MKIPLILLLISGAVVLGSSVVIHSKHSEAAAQTSNSRTYTDKLINAEWHKLLTPEQYRITRQKGTERAFSGKYWDNHRPGIYKCVGCGATLFLSKDKFDSGSGWPSFDRPALKENIAIKGDDSLGMHRDEVVCSKCGAHLGHVFPDGPKSTGERYCINSASLDFENHRANTSPKSTYKSEVEKSYYTVVDDSNLRQKGYDVAYFAAGCFWGVENSFKAIRGVLDTTVGYSGGSTKNPTYEQVSSHMTGHAETVRVVFDPRIISYSQLVTDFLKIHDPTTLNRQGPDIGDQYRSAIFFSDAHQAKEAAEAIKAYQLPLGHSKKIVTQIRKLDVFYTAENYHQDYFAKHGGTSCHIRL